MFTPVTLAVVCGIGVESISPGLAAGMNKACRQSYIYIGIGNFFLKRCMYIMIYISRRAKDIDR